MLNNLSINTKLNTNLKMSCKIKTLDLRNIYRSMFYARKENIKNILMRRKKKESRKYEMDLTFE